MSGQMSLETVILIAICRQLGDKMAIENSVSNNFFYLRSSIVLTFSIAAYSVWISLQYGSILFFRQRAISSIYGCPQLWLHCSLMSLPAASCQFMR